MVITGFSEFMALCMTTENSCQRTCRSCLSLIWAISRPWKTTLPLVMPAGLTSNCEMASMRVDFPHPDSPTTARNSPGLRSKSTLSTATTGSAPVA